MAQEKSLSNVNIFIKLSLKNIYRKAMIRLIKFFLAIVKSFEFLGGMFPSFARFYSNTFYGSLLENELSLAELKKGMKILHIGSGPLPMTAIYLADRDFQVTGVDNDQKAINSSKKVINDLSLEDKITIKNSSGEKLDISNFDAIWLSLHVVPKKEVIMDILESLKPGQKVIFRNPRSFLSTVYPRLQEDDIRRMANEASNFANKNKLEDRLLIKDIKQSLAKESLLVEYKI